MQVGNSEVGHSLIGSGRVVKQDLQKINYDMDKDAFHNNKNLHEFILKVKNSSNNCHLLGLISNGGIHSHIDHIIYFAEMLHYCGIKIFLHLFTDGRDSGMYDSLEFIKQVQEMESKLKNVKLNLKMSFSPILKKL